MKKYMNKKAGRPLSLFLCLAFVFTLCAGFLPGVKTEAEPTGNWTDGLSYLAGYTFGGGDGTHSDPYQINTEVQLAQLALNVNSGSSYKDKYFKLTADLNLSSKYWTPIGILESSPFSGTFDGQRHVITGLTIITGESCIGLFGDADENSFIKNLGLESVSINVDTGYCCGGLAGEANVVTNCYVLGMVTAAQTGYDVIYTGLFAGYVNKAEDCYAEGSVSGQRYVGGFSGGAGKEGLAGIYRCHADCLVTVTSMFGGGGGLIGRLYCDCLVYDSYATGNVICVQNHTNAGGLISDGGMGEGEGQPTQFKIYNCYATGNVTGGTGTVTGGLVGYADALVTNCYATGTVTTAYTYYGSVSGASDPYFASFINCYYNSDNGLNIGVDYFASTLALKNSIVYSDTAIGLTTDVLKGNDENASVPYTYNTSGNTTTALGQDAFIDALNNGREAIDDTGYAFGYWIPDTENKNGGYPVLAYGLVITEQPSGITKSAGETAQFSVSAEISGGFTIYYQWQKSTDGGANWDDLSGETGASYTTGILTQADNGNQYRCVVSANLESKTSGAAILTVTPAGPVFTSGTLANCNEGTTGKVYTATATGTGTITFSISGGVDMADFSIDPSSGELRFVSPPDYEIPSDSNSDNIYEVTLTATDSTGSNNREVSITVLDAIEGSWTDGLSYDADFGFDGGSGTQDDPYQIKTELQLAQLAVNVNMTNHYKEVYFVLTADLDLAGKYWTPIGITENCSFQGNFDGNGHVISYLTIGSETSPFSGSYAGLFGYIGLRYKTTDESNGKVRNTRVTSACLYVNGTSAGVIAGANWGHVLSCNASGNIYSQGNGNAGGLIGENINVDCYGYGVVTNSYAAVDIVCGSGDNGGGLVGDNNGYILNCGATGSVTLAPGSSGSCIGGLVGFSELFIFYSYTAGHVSGENSVNTYVGGFVGKCIWTVTKSYWNSDSYSQAYGLETDHGTPIGKTTEEMKSADFVSLLNEYTVAYSMWTTDNNNINNGFPVFMTYSVQLDSTGSTDFGPLNLNSNAYFLALPAPEKTGCRFDGWYKAEDFIYEWDFDDDSINSNMILYAAYDLGPRLAEVETDRPSATEATAVFVANRNVTYYYKAVENGAAAPTIIPSNAITYDGSGSALKSTEKTITISGLTQTAWDLYILGVDGAMVESPLLKICLPAYETVILADGSSGTAGYKKITGLDSQTKYKVTSGGIIFYVTAAGTLSSNINDSDYLNGTIITGLENGTTYLVETRPPSVGDTVIFAGEEWLCISVSVTDGYKLLKMETCECDMENWVYMTMAFDSGNSNDYAGSDLREYLNGTFFNAFRDAKKALVREANWNCGNELDEDAEHVTDYVGTLTKNEYQDIMDEDWYYECQLCWWLATPYSGDNESEWAINLDLNTYVTILGPLSADSTFEDMISARAALYLKPDTSFQATPDRQYEALDPFQVTYDGNGSSGGSVPIDSGYYLKGDEAKVLGNSGALGLTGYTFAGWNTQADGKGTDYSPDDALNIKNNITLYARWTATPVDLTANTLDNGTYGLSYSYDISAAKGGSGSFTYALTSGALPNGLNFGGTNISGIPSETGTFNFTITATDKVNSMTDDAAYSIVIQTAGTVVDPAASPAAGAVEKDDTVTLSTTTAGSSIYYTTNGNEPTISSSPFSTPIAINAALTIKAIAVKTGFTDSQVATFIYTLKTHTVTYDANGGSGTAPTESPKATGAVFNAAGNTFTAPVNKQFQGWNTSGDDSGDSYAPGDPVTMPAGNITLYAIWKDAAAPAITSADNAAFTVNTHGSFAVTANGIPAPVITCDGTLPAGVTFDDAAFTLSGTPSAGTGGDYPLTFTASNGILPDALQSFVLTVFEAEIRLKQGSNDMASGDSYSFGNVVIYFSSDAVFTIKNRGNRILSVSSPVSISGMDADQFKVVSQPESPVAAGGDTSFTIRFVPTSLGKKTASITIVNNSTNRGTYILDLTATARPLGHGVGGEVRPVNKTGLMLPWVILGTAIPAAVIWGFRRRGRRIKSPPASA
jgi:uncharacterized repeat protein (TIGR02543 family)